MKQEQSVTPKRPAKRSRWFYGWTIVIVVAVTSFAGGAEQNPVLGVFQGPMTEEFGWTRAMYALPVSIGSFLGGLAGMAVGPIIDRHGPRWVLTIAAFLLGLAFVLMGAVQELWHHITIQIVARTVMTSTFFMIVGIVVPKWFVVRRGRAVALANLGQRASVIVFPVMVERILHVSSWRTGWVSMGLTVWAVALLPAMLFLRRRPEDHGMLPDGVDPNELEARPQAGAPKRRPAAAEVNVSARQALHIPAFYIVATVVAIQSIANTSIQFHWFTYLTDRNVSSAAAVVSIAIAPLIAMPVSVGAGFLAERLSVQKTMAGAYLLMATSVLVLLSADDSFGAYAFGVAFGVTSGVMTTSVQLVWPYFFGRESVGAIRGMVAPFHMAANAIGPVAAALSYDFLGGYAPAYSTVLALCLLGGVLLLLARRPKAPAPATPAA